MNPVIKSPVAKAIVAGIGSAISFLELALTPHTWPWLVLGAVLLAGTTAGVWNVPNVGTPVSPAPQPYPMQPNEIPVQQQAPEGPVVP